MTASYVPQGENRRKASTLATSLSPAMLGRVAGGAAEHGRRQAGGQGGRLAAVLALRNVRRGHFGCLEGISARPASSAPGSARRSGQGRGRGRTAGRPG